MGLLDELLAPERLKSKWEEPLLPPPPPAEEEAPPPPSSLDELFQSLRQTCAARFPAPSGDGLMRMIDALEHRAVLVDRARAAGSDPKPADLAQVRGLAAAVADVADALELGRRKP
jgi:hypothetical protein